MESAPERERRTEITATIITHFRTMGIIQKINDMRLFVGAVNWPAIFEMISDSVCGDEMPT